MAANSKKVILFIVEGPTDEDALSPVLKKIFQNNQVRFHVVHGDITSEASVNSTNVIRAVNAHIKKERDRYGFRHSDILRVVHLIDTDGAFIPDSNVVAGEAVSLQYENDQIVSPRPGKTIERNARKKQIVTRLYPTKKIDDIPYAVFYFSRNLEHVLHNKANFLTDSQKADYADAFADQYATAPDRFIQFLSHSDFTVQGDYGESWHFIFEDTNSLHRHCNLHLLFQPESVFAQ